MIKLKFFIILILASIQLSAQNDSIIIYRPFSEVEKSIVSIDENYNIQGISPFIDSCADARVVYTGESHNFVEFNNLFSFAILKELNAKHHFTGHIIELGPARAAHFNKFLQGDSVAEVVLKATTSFRHFEFYSMLKKWNDTLAPHNKITVYGIDVERFNDIGIANLALILQKQNHLAPLSIRQAVESIIYKGNSILESGKYYYDIKSTYYSDVYTVSRTQTARIINDFETNKNDFKLFLGTDFEAFYNNIIYVKEYLTFKEYSGTPMEHNWRETNMYQRLQQLIDSLPGHKFYGQFGRCHSMLSTNDREVCSWYNFRSTIERVVKNNPTVKTKTLGIFYGSSSFSDDEVNKDIYKNGYAGRITLFNLNYNPQGHEKPRLASEYDFVLNTQKLYDNKLILKNNVKPKFVSMGIVLNPSFSVANMDNIYNQLQLYTIVPRASSAGMYINHKGRSNWGFNYSIQWKTKEHFSSNSLSLDTAIDARYKLNLQLLQPTFTLLHGSKYYLQLGAGLAVLRNKIGVDITKKITGYEQTTHLNIINYEVNPIVSLNYYYILGKNFFIGAEGFYFFEPINPTHFTVKQNGVLKQTFNNANNSIFQNTYNLQLKIGTYVY